MWLRVFLFHFSFTTQIIHKTLEVRKRSEKECVSNEQKGLFNIILHEIVKNNFFIDENIYWEIMSSFIHINLPCCVDILLAVLTVIDGVFVIFVLFPSVAFVSFESCRDNENRREFIPKFATPLVTLATSELKKLIFMVIFSLVITIIYDIFLMNS